MCTCAFEIKDNIQKTLGSNKKITNNHKHFVPTLQASVMMMMMMSGVRKRAGNQ